MQSTDTLSPSTHTTVPARPELDADLQVLDREADEPHIVRGLD